ncbi:cytochrome c oxidase subunit VIa-domain-containing protein [Mycena maculata]|uniref:Cytochrome c oxidase subunit VIa-domain-containing protein n=1 Tax=Mycena maculata TaxID=230809 RepID=A0AAD7P1G5_9AGAR|nr:cytochrome c oxidase subunit VIa-domain-containing protein [Mycena maculata]
MSFLPRRALLLSSPAVRAYSDTAVSVAKAKWLANQKAIEHHALQTTDFWRKMSYYVCIPALVAIFGTYVYNVEIEHKAHNEHLMAENDGKLPQPPRYEYLNKRNKPFPWGPNSLFFNPKASRCSRPRSLD